MTQNDCCVDLDKTKAELIDINVLQVLEGRRNILGETYEINESIVQNMNKGRSAELWIPSWNYLSGHDIEYSMEVESKWADIIKV